MLPRVGRALAVLLVVSALIGIVYILYLAIKETARVFASLDKTVEAAFIAASATVLASAITITIGKIYELRLHVEKENREKKIPVYEDLLKFMFRTLNSKNTGATLEDPEVIEFMTTFNQRFIVWASDKVMVAWMRWRRHFTDGTVTQEQPHEGLFLIEDLMFAIRRDLGHANKNLGEGDVLALFINDIDALPRRGQQSRSSNEV